MPLTLKQANTICDKALEHARAKKFAKLTVVVLDDSGNVKAVQRDADNSILGAVGISGASGDEDEECAAKGVEAAGLKPDASA